jgi:anti-sigma regulatory factor (Ser/Thr protein kinase)
VKSILNRFSRKGGPKHAIQGDLPIQLPPPIPIKNPFDAQRRSLTGMVAREMARQLQVEPRIQDLLVYLPFAMETFTENGENEAEYILFLSERMVCWIKDDEDIYFRVKEMKLPGRYHENFLKVFEQVKGGIYPIYFHSLTGKLGEPDEQEGMWQVYRDVMYAVTQRKFLLVQKHEINAYKQGTLLYEHAILERADIPKTREAAKRNLLENGFHPTQVTGLVLVISEGITNILKHAEEGKLSIVQNGREVYVIIEDRGPGFDLKLLPNTTLMAGYSTKKSLGQGFTLMMKMAEQVVLATNSEGSAVILKFVKNEDAANDEKSNGG